MPLSSIGKIFPALITFTRSSRLLKQLLLVKPLKALVMDWALQIFSNMQLKIFLSTVLTSSFRKMATKKDHHNTVQDGIHNIQDMPKAMLY